MCSGCAPDSTTSVPRNRAASSSEARRNDHLLPRALRSETGMLSLVGRWSEMTIGMPADRAALAKSTNRSSSRSSVAPSSTHTTSARSEEHTSELQSLAYLVCRLLLEKKKKIKDSIYLNTAAQE